VLGTILTIQQALKYFGSRGGSVINISSIASLNPTPDSVVYSATKSAVDSITRGLAKELGAPKIRVNAIAPGGTVGRACHGRHPGERFRKADYRHDAAGPPSANRKTSRGWLCFWPPMTPHG
jgi:NAD(P)-dependent dehydrogenase (short-subunit alcohol dehydrogenase family)